MESMLLAFIRELFFLASSAKSKFPSNFFIKLVDFCYWFVLGFANVFLLFLGGYSTPISSSESKFSRLQAPTLSIKLSFEAKSNDSMPRQPDYFQLYCCFLLVNNTLFLFKKAFSPKTLEYSSSGFFISSLIGSPGLFASSSHY